MTKPTPSPLDPAKVRELPSVWCRPIAFRTWPAFDGDQPRLRPVSPSAPMGSLSTSLTCASITRRRRSAANPKVELCYLDDHHDQVRITGVADVLTDRTLLQEIWDANPLLRQYLGSIDNPQLIVYCIRPTHVRYMREWALEYTSVPLESTVK